MIIAMTIRGVPMAIEASFYSINGFIIVAIGSVHVTGAIDSVTGLT